LLDKLITEIKNGNTTSAADLARKLDTSPAMVEAMLDTLERHGYVRTFSNLCQRENACESCSLSGICSQGGEENGSVRVFNLR
jgi:ribosomal protein S8